MAHDREVRSPGAELRRLGRRVSEARTGAVTAAVCAAFLLAGGERSLAVAAALGAVCGAVLAVRARRRRAAVIRAVLLARRYRELTALHGERVSMRERHALARTLRRAATSRPQTTVRRGARTERLLRVADVLDDPRRTVEVETMVLARRLLRASRESSLAASVEPGSELDALLVGIEGAIDEAA